MAFSIVRKAGKVLLCLAALSCQPLWAQAAAQGDGAAALPNLGDSSDMTPGAERRLGDRIARELFRDPDYLDDPVVMEYVQSVWQPLVAAARLRGDLTPQVERAFAWQILLGRDRSVNAFALPGGYLGLHLGLVAVVASRDELASVLAHELSHVTQRHIARSIARQGEQAPWLIGAMILGALAASKNPGAANAMIVGGQAAAVQTQLNFSRDMEREADRVGYGVMTQAGFVPQAFVSMFEKLQQSGRLNDSGGFPYLRSHPLTTERIADMQARVPPAASPALPALALDHAMVSARARVLANAGVDALRAWERERLDQRRSGDAALQAGTLYGATLAGLKLRDFAAAGRALQELQAVVRAHPAAARLARLLAAELALAQGDAAAAGRALAGGAVAGRPEVLLRAQVGLQGGDAAGAAQLLQTWLADQPGDAQAWQWLARADAAQGRTVEAIRAEAEVNVAQLDYAAALTRLKAAQELGRSRPGTADHIAQSIVDTRARQIELILREQALER